MLYNNIDINMSSNYILISFFDGYDKSYEDFTYVFMLVKSNSINFNINDNIKYKVFKVSEFNENYNEVISVLFSKLPFKFEKVAILDKKQQLQTLVMPKQVYLSMENKYDPSKIQLVVAYYNEDLSWIEYLRKECCISNVLLISKKHTNHPKYKLVHLPNLGREANSFMWYITKYFDNLPEIIFFCQGGVKSNKMKYNKFLYVVKNLVNVDKIGCITVPGHLSTWYSAFDYDFTLKNWKSTNNLNENDDSKLIPSSVRPFGKWYETFISNDITKISKYGHSYNAIFCTTKQSIMKFPKCTYEELYNQTLLGENTEVAHYLERVYYSMFINNYLIDRIHSLKEYHIFEIQNNQLLKDSKTQNKDINNRCYQFSLLLQDAISGIQQNILNLKIGYIHNDLGEVHKDVEKLMRICDITFVPVNTFPTKRKLLHKNIVQLGSFGFQQFGKDEYQKETELMLEIGKTPALYNKIVWYGNITTNPIRSQFYSIAKNNPKIFHVIDVNKQKSDIWENPNFLSMPEQAKLGHFLIDIPGQGWSARLQTFMFSNRPIIIVKPHFCEHWFYDLVPWKHYIPVKSDLSDLSYIITWCFQNESAAQQIAKNALEYAKHNLKREHEVSRIRDSILNVLN